MRASNEKAQRANARLNFQTFNETNDSTKLRRIHAHGDRALNELFAELSAGASLADRLPLFHFLDEVERGEPLRAHLEVYARLPVAFIKANNGDQFAPAVHIVDGDGR